MDAKGRASATGPLEAGRLDRYLGELIGFIALSTLFEGYDVIILNLALPSLAKEFGASVERLGFAVSAISLGTIAAFFLVRLADRYGRRPVLLSAIAGYSLFTFFTALSTGLVDFVAYQFVARALMVTEIGVGSIVLTEELPARYRGLGIGIMIGLASVGGLLAALLFPFLLQSGLGWRGLYALGVLPVALVLFFRPRMRETRRWLQGREAAGERRDRGMLGRLREEVALISRREHRRSFLIAFTYWFSTSGFTAATLFFWAYFVTNERGWGPAEVSRTLVWGYALGILGYGAVGFLLDSLGRKATTYLYFGLGGICGFLCFRAQDPWLISVLYMIIICMGGIWTICATVSSELFPTKIRAAANAVANNLLGRTGMVLAPALVGILSSRLGSVGEAVSLVSLGLFLPILVTFFWMPETRGRMLEEIVPEAGGVQPPAIGRSTRPIRPDPGGNRDDRGIQP